MFKGQVHLYKNVDGKEEEVKKDFDNEKDFDEFVDKNPELKKLREFEWEPIRWPSLTGLNEFFSEAERLGKTSILDDMEAEMKALFDRSRKLLGK